MTVEQLEKAAFLAEIDVLDKPVLDWEDVEWSRRQLYIEIRSKETDPDDPNSKTAHGELRRKVLETFRVYSFKYPNQALYLVAKLIESLTVFKEEATLAARLMDQLLTMKTSNNTLQNGAIVAIGNIFLNGEECRSLGIQGKETLLLTDIQAVPEINDSDPENARMAKFIRKDLALKVGLAIGLKADNTYMPPNELLPKMPTKVRSNPYAFPDDFGSIESNLDAGQYTVKCIELITEVMTSNNYAHYQKRTALMRLINYLYKTGNQENIRLASSFSLRWQKITGQTGEEISLGRITFEGIDDEGYILTLKRLGIISKEQNSLIINNFPGAKESYEREIIFPRGLVEDALMSGDREKHIKARKMITEMMQSRACSPQLKFYLFTRLVSSLLIFNDAKEIGVATKLSNLFINMPHNKNEKGEDAKDGFGNFLCDITLNKELCTFLGLTDKDGNEISALVIEDVSIIKGEQR